MRGLRFHRRIPLIPGVLWINVSKTGVSLSFSLFGLLTLNFAVGGQTTTLNLPGTGLSYRKRRSYWQR